MKKILITTFTLLLFIAVVGLVKYDANYVRVSTITLDKEVKYVDKATNSVLYYGLISTNGEMFRIDNDDVVHWINHRLYHGVEYQITTKGYFYPCIAKVVRQNNKIYERGKEYLYHITR